MPGRFDGKVVDGQKVVVGIRPDDIAPVGHGMFTGEQSETISLPVNISEPQGTETILFVTLAGKEVQSKMLSPRLVEDGETLAFQVSLDKIHVFDRQTEQSVLAEV